MPRNLDYYQVDAFTNNVFQGNPAGVCPVTEPLSDELMQKIANENNLSETAFLEEVEGDDADFSIRWFTPTDEVNLCGHATLASAYVVFHHLCPELETVRFSSKSAQLIVRKKPNGHLEMDFPIWHLNDKTNDAPDFGASFEEVFESEDYLCVLASEKDVREFEPDFDKLASQAPRCVIVTAAADGSETDFVSRVFCPAVGVPEDPVTGSAHCALTPYWGKRLNKTELSAKQISSRGGDLTCRLNGDRVFISGRAALFLTGKIHI